MRIIADRNASIFARTTILVFLIGVGAIWAGLSFLVSKPAEGDFHFELGKGRSLDIYCEGEFFYEPPGYVSYSVRQNGKVLVPKHRFRSIGAERVPSGRVEMVMTGDGDTVAIRRNFDVIILHDFKSNRTWPRQYGEFQLNDYLLAKELLERFKSEGQELYCTAVQSYLSSYLPSPDGQRIVLQFWDKKEYHAELNVRVINQQGEILHELRGEENEIISMEDIYSRKNWSAGWLSENRFGVWTLNGGTHIWDFKEDGTCVELPAPLDPELVTQLKEKTAPRMRSFGINL
ncbi:hypothetical protein CA11_46770 [Gimesia maris]|uniref:hypothetical protein n=1 Tax=Gimesia maris TaxID=122 RepID=UPI00118C621C|nr:hypothetical protein [Gimesia maris]QDU16841.1 hypothetical protein CA11_46770 [Gimesia maris]